ncbi:ACT domain-containing protein [Domibacillus tundrae]|uniref:ACT domain-containing protein n=1 Tax=Domibacillus tundrae TaxID=1587527 RepID=UPI0033941137
MEGPLDFSLTGVLSSLASPLAEAKISIFAISTYNTDFLLVKSDTLEQTLQILSKHGHSVI